MFVVWRSSITDVNLASPVSQAGSQNTLSQLTRPSRLRWLSQVMDLANTDLSTLDLFSVPTIKWSNTRSGQQMAWQSGIGKCQSYGSTTLGPDHALVCTMPSMCFVRLSKSMLQRRLDCDNLTERSTFRHNLAGPQS